MENTLKFWAHNSCGHIEVLQNLFKTIGERLDDEIKVELTKLFEEFNFIDTQLIDKEIPDNYKQLKLLYVQTSKLFLEVLDELNIEDYCEVYPVIFETVRHFIYAQLYSIQLFHEHNNEHKVALYTMNVD
ncbi:MAG: hypothetical protein ATN35_03440 [Epulopiscium sp. Nele67-Bin004]|nr:MAG: hypothetical protein ATN35_03440 [Epulopiscium sp. Nele67-Bin004]